MERIVSAIAIAIILTMVTAAALVLVGPVASGSPTLLCATNGADSHPSAAGYVAIEDAFAAVSAI
jgi:hypothetical protein